MPTSYELTEQPDMVLRLPDRTLIPRGHRLWGEFERWISEGNDPASAPTLSLAELKTNLVERVDDHIASIYARWMRFQAEYEAREASARKYAADGYVGEPDAWVAAFATAAGMSAASAAAVIIGQSDALRQALVELAQIRMRKYSLLPQQVGSMLAMQIFNQIISDANSIEEQLT